MINQDGDEVVNYFESLKTIFKRLSKRTDSDSNQQSDDTNDDPYTKL